MAPARHTLSMTWEWVEQRLAGTHNYWLAVNRADRAPYVRPVWCAWDGRALLFTSSPRSLKARLFVLDPRVSVQLELEREVVVVEGVVGESSPSDERIAAYAAKYRWTPPPAQQWYEIAATRVYASDEATYPEGASSFDL